MGSMLRGNGFAARALVAALILGFVSPAWAAYVITPQGARIDGSDIRAKANGEIVLTTPAGTRTFYPGQYTRAVADKPAEFDQAKRLADSGNHDEAIRLLKDIVARFRFLEWDNQARLALPAVYMAKGDFAAAAETYEEVLKGMAKDDAALPEIQWAYREALLKAGQYPALEKQLDETIAGGSRSDAARAQIMRGDLRRAQKQIEAAALDYLRTMVLFESEKAHQPEATFKAAQALEELRDRRAKDLYRTVAEQYPNSPYAAEARGKL